ncbi:hypothetical protein CR513_27729, partial [Mucuna pruriens]
MATYEFRRRHIGTWLDPRRKMRLRTCRVIPLHLFGRPSAPRNLSGVSTNEGSSLKRSYPSSSHK